MTKALRARPLTGWMCGVAFVALVAGLVVAISAVPGGRASAGGGGAPYGVYVTTGPSEVELPATNLSGTPNPVASGGLEVLATALNATATLGLTTLAGDGQNLSDVDIFTVPGNGSFGTITRIEPIGFAADPVNPAEVFAVDQVGNVYALSLNAGTQAGPAPIAVIAPPGTPSVTCTSIAVTPDGTQVVIGFNLNGNPYLEEVNTANGAITARWAAPRPEDVDAVESLAIAPNGSAVYAGLQGTVGYVLAVPLPLIAGAKTVWGVSTRSITEAKAVTVSPSGATVYVGGIDGTTSATSTVETFNSGSGAFGQSVPVPMQTNANAAGGLTGIALSPDAATLYAVGATTNAAGAVSSQLCPVATSGLAVSALPCVSLGATNATDPEDDAVTPDQAPVAGLTSVSGTAGSPVNFDASSSTVTYRSIVNYAWNFGDGNTTNTSGPTVSHTFAAQGTYTVTVTETDSAGTSIPPASPAPGRVNGPGTTAYLDASPSAALSEQVPVSKKGTPPPPPPSTTTTTSTTLRHGATTTTTLPGTPTITLVPTVGPPGTIVNVSGHGFPPNRMVTVSWSTNTGSYTEMTDSHGNLPSQVFYILTPDILGPRQAVAATTGVPAAKANFLVVIRTSEPGGGLGAAFFRSEGE